MKNCINRIAATLFIMSYTLLAQAENPSPCKIADELMAAGELTSARKNYAALLKATSTLECARYGLDKTRDRELKAETHWRRGGDLLLSGQREEARIVFLKALEIAPSRDDIRKQLEVLLDNENEVNEREKNGGKSPDPYAVAEGLMDAGYEAEAKKKAREVWGKGVDKNLPKRLRVNKFDRFAEWASGIGINAGKIGTAFLALVLLIWILWLAIRKLWLQRPWAKPRPCQVIIEEIDDPRTDLKVGRDLRERLAEELSHASSPATRLRRVSQPGTTPIPQVEKLPTPVKFLGPLLRWAQTPVRFHIAAEVHLPVNNIAGLSVTIHNDRGGLEARESFRMKIEGEERETYLELGILAGAWVVFELQRLQFPKSRSHELKVLGTTRWKSYGLFRRGERAALAERVSGHGSRDIKCHDSREMKLFDHALAEDHNNIGALIVLGKWQSHNVEDEDAMFKGIEHLQRARQLLDKDSLAKAGRFRAIAETRIDPLWFQATYELAVAYLHRFASQEEIDENSTKMSGSSGQEVKEEILDDLEEGIKIATELAKAIGATQLTLGTWWRRRAISPSARRSLQLMLHQDAKYLVGVLAGAKASWEWIRKSSLLPKNENVPPSSKLGGKKLDDKKLDRELWMWLSNLDHEKLPSAESLVVVVERDKDKAGWAALYNLACFYSRARQADKAYAYLEQYFEHVVGYRKEIQVAWARCDPTLKPARIKKKDDFEKLLTLPTPPPTLPAASTPKAPAGEWVVEHFDGP